MIRAESDDFSILVTGFNEPDQLASVSVYVCTAGRDEFVPEALSVAQAGDFCFTLCRTVDFQKQKIERICACAGYHL